MRTILSIVCVVVIAGCGTRPRIEVPNGKVSHGPLRNVILLPLTTRSTDGLLGHVLGEDGVTPNRSRAIFRGEPKITETSQNITVIRELEVQASVAADYGPLAARIASGELTHLAYVVRITGCVEFQSGAEYRAESDCCFDGRVHERCAAGFVERLVRGSGTIKYLTEASTKGGINAASLFETSAGERYRVLDEYTFEDAFFAFETGNTANLCRTLPDAATFEATKVTPAPNCSVMAYDLKGDSAHLAKFLPDQETCRTVAANFCANISDCVKCVGSFNNGTEQLVFSVQVTASTAVGNARMRGAGSVRSTARAVRIAPGDQTKASEPSPVVREVSGGVQQDADRD